MTANDLKQIGDLVDEKINKAIEPLRQGINGVKQNMDGIKQTLEEVKNTQETRVLPPVTYIETTVKSYADRYVANEDHIRRLDKRLSTVEDNLKIQPPEELTIPSFK